MNKIKGPCTCGPACTILTCSSLCACEHSKKPPAPIDLLEMAMDSTSRALGSSHGFYCENKVCRRLGKHDALCMSYAYPPKAARDVSFDAACRAMAESIAALVISKQHDYGQQNIKMGRGLLGIAIRIGDKVARLQNLVFEGKEPKNETLVDTLMDIAGYAVVGLMWNEGTFELPLEE